MNNLWKVLQNKTIKNNVIDDKSPLGKIIFNTYFQSLYENLSCKAKIGQKKKRLEKPRVVNLKNSHFLTIATMIIANNYNVS